MKKTKLFNVNLFRDTIRELLPLALLFLGIMIIFTCFNISESAIGISGISNTEGHIFIPLPFVNYASMLFSILGTAVMTVYVFRFADRRNSSDLYFSFPESRLSLFDSRLASVMICSLVIIVINGIAAALLYRIFSEYYVIKAMGILVSTLSLMLVCTVTACAFALAMSLTGKVFGGVILGVMILLTPGYIITELNGYLKHSLFFADADISSAWGGMNGLVFETLKSLVSGETSYLYLSNRSALDFLAAPKNILFELAVGIIMYFVAAYAFGKRATEIADNVKYSKGKQAVFGIWIAFLISFAVCPKLLAQITGVSEANEAGVFYLLGAVLAAVAYFLYLFVTQKDVKTAARLIYGVLIAFVFDALLMGSAYAFVQKENSFLPEAEEIKGVHLVSFDSSYAGEKLKDYFVADKEAIGVVQKSYKAAYKAKEKGLKHEGEEYCEFDIIFDTRSGKKKRYVYMTKEDAKLLCDRLCSDKKISESFDDIPPINELEKNGMDKITAGAISKALTESVNSSNGEIDSKKLYELFYEDVKEHGMGESEIRSALGFPSEEERIAFLCISSYKEEDTFELHISEKDKRSIAYINECFEKKRRNEVDKIINIIRNPDSYKDYKILVNISLDGEEAGAVTQELEKTQIKQINPEKLKDQLYEMVPSVPDSRENNCFSISVNNGKEWIYRYSFGISGESDIPAEIKEALEKN